MISMFECCNNCSAPPRFNLIIIGAPGAGKGTQSKRIAEKYSLAHITSGELLREEAKRDSDLSQRINKLMKTGTLFPDDLVKQVLLDNVPKSNFILDGYPRKISQTDTFTDIDMVIFIDIPKHVCISRVLNRNEGRSDDTEKAVKTRLECFKKETEPVIEYYEKLGILKRIDGNGTEDEVFKNICNAMFEKFGQ